MYQQKRTPASVQKTKSSTNELYQNSTHPPKQNGAWQHASQQVLDRLDLPAAYRELGVDVVGDEPGGNGWIKCRSIGRDDRNPSAGIYCGSGKRRGRYKDFASGESLGLFDFAAKYGNHADWKEARRHYAQLVGVKLPGGKAPEKIGERFIWQDWKDALAVTWVGHKQGVSIESIVRAGGRLARYHAKSKNADPVIAIPYYGPELLDSDPTGYTMWHRGGKTLPVWQRKGEPPTRVKMKSVGPAGWMGAWGLHRLQSADVIWKVEGPVDMLALMTAIPEELQESHVVITNSSGTHETPRDEMIEHLAGRIVYVLHDADEPGQEGGEIWAKAIADYAAECRLVKLPYDVAEKKGKDVRDWLNEGGDYSKLLAMAEKTEPITEADIQKSNEATATVEPNEALDDPHRLANMYRFNDELWYWRDEWYRWDGCAYRVIRETEIRAEITGCVKNEFDSDNIDKLQEWKLNPDADTGPPECKKVTKSLTGNIIQALQGNAILPSTLDQPSWLFGDEPFPAVHTLATKSGLLHLSNLIDGKPSLLPPTPAFFSTNALPYPFDAHAECHQWLRFLKSLWGDDEQSVNLLQEWFGYCLLPDTQHHKLLMLIGPPRSGKGTIGRVLRGLIGDKNLASPTLSGLAGPFGLQPLVGKLVALVADARLSGRTDAIAVVERLLSISGEDPLDVHRKHLPTLPGMTLPVRFVVMTNELPNMRDASGALTTRVLLLRLTESFIGREDKTLTSRLLDELPGVLNWSIIGWQRLNKRGYFQQPESGSELLEDLEDLASPIRHFLRERCIVGPEYEAQIGELFPEWKSWCEEHGRDHPGTHESFGKNLHAALPQLKVSKLRRDGRRERVYRGVGTKS